MDKLKELSVNDPYSGFTASGGVITFTDSAWLMSFTCNRQPHFPDQPDDVIVFWVYALALAWHALFGTALTFHVVSIFAEAGRTTAEAFGYFLPVALVSTSTNMLASWASDRTALRPWLLVMLVSLFVAGIGVLLLDSSLGYGVLVLGQGLGGGIWGMISNITWVRLFGRVNLGAISGLNASLMVSFSAVGPALFALGMDLGDSFRPAVWICMAGFVLLLGGALFTRRLPAEAAP
jgi:MFS family permease